MFDLLQELVLKYYLASITSFILNYETGKYIYKLYSFLYK